MTIDELIKHLYTFREKFGGDAVVGISANEYIGEDISGKKKYYNYKLIPVDRVSIASKGTYTDLNEDNKCIVLIPPFFNDLYVNHDPSEKKERRIERRKL